MGNTSHDSHSNQELGLKIRMLMDHKLKRYRKLQRKVLLILKQLNQIQSLDEELRALFYEVKSSKNADNVIPCHELSAYLLANLHSIEGDKESLKARRKEFFNFAKLNLSKTPEFILSRVIQRFNSSVKGRLEDGDFCEVTKIKSLIASLLKITKLIIMWFYGEQIVKNLIGGDSDNEINQQIYDIYIAQLCEFVIFFDKSELNYLSKLRNRQIDLMSNRIKTNILNTITKMKNSQNIPNEGLFPKGDPHCYDIILQYIEKLASAPLLSTKYKFICIIFDNIPTLYIQSEIKRSKSSSQYKSVEQKHVSISSIHAVRNIELENTISDLLATQTKRELAKYLIIEWYKQTDKDIIKDILIPLKILMEQSYLKQSNRSALLAFAYAVFESVGVDEMENSQIV